MNFLKKFRAKDKFNLVIDFFYEYVFIKRSAFAFGASLIFSFFIIQTSVPQFSLSATLRDASSADQSSRVMIGGAQGIFGGEPTLGGALQAFQSNMYSYALAKRMWNSGWGSRIYGNGEMDEEYFNKIPKRHQLSDRIASFLLGYNLNDYYSAHDLQSYIRSYEINQERESGNITLSALKSNKDFSIEFMNALIIETDNYAKESLILKSKEIIASTYNQLAISKNSSIASALGNTINSEYYKIANLENDMPYHINIIDPPYSSEYPVTPNVPAITFSNIIIFIFLSILISFILKNKDDLW